MEPKKPAPQKAVSPAPEESACARPGFSEAPAPFGLDALPDNAPADVRARLILNLYPDLFRALAKA